MGDLGEHLERIGLYQYLETLVAEGFETWETVLDITESDLKSLNVKLGHRRKLQRAIAESRGQSGDRSFFIKNASVDGSNQSKDSTQESKTRRSEQPVPGTAGISTKRKYRRHPKPDEYAPERPPSAYVIFSSEVRGTLKGQGLPFTEIAKVVGERWQVLSADARKACECQANAAKEKYYVELAEYKKTSVYDAYQKYLEDFKAKHAAPPKVAEGKRSKIKTNTITSTSGTWSRSDEQVDRLQNRRVSSVQSDDFAIDHHSPPVVPVQLSSGPSYPSNSASRAAQSLSRLNSPLIRDQYTPSFTTSPRPAALYKENPYELYTSEMTRNVRGHSDRSIHYPSNPYGHSLQHIASKTLPAAYGSHYPSPINLPSLRSFQEPVQLPLPSKEDKTLWSDSSDSGYNTTTYPGPLLPVVNSQKLSLILPRPVPSLGATRSPLDRYPLAAPSPQIHTKFRTNPSLAVLPRARELARVANDEELEKEGSLSRIT